MSDTVEIDPVTYEVVKHRLWQINEEQGATIRTVSTSPIVVEGNDFNVGLFTDRGELAVTGPYVLIHVTTMNAVIRNVIELAGEVSPGDVFLVNDPYLGAIHQNDVAVVTPIFHDDKLVMWAGNVLHHADLAGLDEGSFCINATNVFQEAPRYFLKIVDRGVLSHTAERTFTTNTRLPDMVALDLRAQLGALNVVRSRLLDLMGEYSSALVRRVMARSIEDSRAALRRRIESLTDGSWSTDVYMDGDRVGSDRLLRVRLTLTKSGDRLAFDYTGTDSQSAGAVNATSFASYAGTTVPVYTFLYGNEIDWNASIEDLVSVHAPEGTVMNAQYPAAVSVCSVGFTWLACAAATRVVADMLSATPEFADRACASWAPACNANNIFGVDSEGRYVGALLSDHRGGGAAGRPFADGFDHAGMLLSYLSSMSNVESQEYKLPLLYLFRRQLVDSGGPGQFRGGLSIMSAFTPHGTDRLTWKSQNTAGSEQSNALGLNGGLPGAGSQVAVARSVLTRESTDDLVLDWSALAGRVECLPTKSEGSIAQGDIFLFYPPGGGGFGDPLLREPALVQRDVGNRWVSRDYAERAYGVIIGPDNQLDDKATVTARQQQRQERRTAGRWTPSADPLGPEPVPSLSCPSCGAEAWRTEPDGRISRYLTRGRLNAAGPWICLSTGGDSELFELEQTICPDCGLLLDTREHRVEPHPVSA